MNYYSQIERVGEGDLTTFRDAVLTYCAALKAKDDFYFSGSAEAGELLRWLGIHFKETSVESESPPWSEGRSLARTAALPKTALADFRSRGYLGTTLFAALVRSSYGPDEPGFFPTQSELGFYFEESKLLSGEARWDEDYLEECQEFFFEELTPAELVDEVYALVPQAAEGGEPHRESLEGVAFLIGEQTTTLLPLTRFFKEILVSNKPLPELSTLVKSVDGWTEEEVQGAWESCAPSEYAREVFSGLPIDAHVVLQACGPELLAWRNER